MAISPNDILYVLSGGRYNSDPNKSLGGDPSSRTIWGTMNNLFADVTSIEAQEGYVDYRCLYIVNNHTNDSFYDVRLFIETQIAGGSNIKIGVAEETDIQQVIISGIAEGGSFTVAYEDYNIIVPWELILANWAKHLQDGLNAIPELGGVEVDVSSYPNEGSTRDITRVFEVRFAGVSNNRYHPILTLVSNDIVAPTKPQIQIIKVKDGCPINSIAAKIDTETIEPYGIEWGTPSALQPILVGTMRAGDSFPVWVQRTTPANASPLIQDGFKLRTLGRPFVL